MKTLLLFLITLSSLFAEAKIYMGTNYGLFSESFNDIEASSSESMATLKIGYGDIKAYAVEFSVEYARNRSKIFSSSPTASSDGNKFGFNVALMKAFDYTYLYPFVRVGFGTGYLDVERNLEKNLTYGSFQGSVGSFIPLSDSFDIEVAYELRHTSYEAVNYIVTKTSYSSVSNIGYFGINYRF